jgi:hypothetical protein
VITHVVLCRLKENVPPYKIEQLIKEIDGLRQQIPGFLSLESGENLKLEPHHHGFSVGFVARFTNRQSLSDYQNHPEHRETGRLLVDYCEDGFNGLLVFDYENN